MRNPFKTRYRVFEVKKGNDTSKFYPQYRIWCWFWKGVPERPNASSVAVYGQLDYAEEFLFDMHKDVRDKKIVGTEAHEFNEVFYKLKNTEKERDPEHDMQRHW